MGWGIAANRAKALELYQQALAAGNAEASKNIDRLGGQPAAQAQ